MHCGGWRDRDSVIRAGRRIEVATIVWMKCVFMATEAVIFRRVYDLFWQVEVTKGVRKLRGRMRFEQVDVRR
jgi:hypothetical protein